MSCRPAKSVKFAAAVRILMPGYYKRPDLTEQAIIDGWLHSGDMGYVDEDGFLYLVDRMKDMIISGGVNVYPRDIEEVVVQHPDVREAAVFGAAARKVGRNACGGRRAARNRRKSRPDELKQWINQRVGAKFQRVHDGDHHGGLSAQRCRQDPQTRDAG